MDDKTVDQASLILVRYEALATLTNGDSDVDAVRLLLESINQDFRLFLDSKAR
jgi:hypothetical protein